MPQDGVTTLIYVRDVSCVHCRIRVQRCDTFANTINPSAEMTIRRARGDL